MIDRQLQAACNSLQVLSGAFCGDSVVVDSYVATVTAANAAATLTATSADGPVDSSADSSADAPVAAINEQT